MIKHFYKVDPEYGSGIAKLIGLNDLNTRALIALVLLPCFGVLGMK